MSKNLSVSDLLILKAEAIEKKVKAKHWSPKEREFQRGHAINLRKAAKALR